MAKTNENSALNLEHLVLIKQAIDAVAAACDNTELNGKVAALEDLIAKDADGVINKFNEIVDFLKDVTDDKTLEGIIAGLNQAIAAKYAKPTNGIPKTDLDASVQASLGKADTALQTSDIADMAKKSEMSVVAGTGTDADKTTITLKSGTSATVLTQHQDISGKVDKVANKQLSSEDYTAAEKEKLGALPTRAELTTEIGAKQNTISDLSTIRSNAANGQTAYGWGNHADAGYIVGEFATNAEVRTILGLPAQG